MTGAGSHPDTPSATHAGGVVVRSSLTGPRYLVVTARADPSKWVLPKGHIEGDEKADATAKREVREEAGVEAEPVAELPPLMFRKGGADCLSRMYLMRYLATVPAQEQREVAWLPFEQAVERLTHDDAKQSLAHARSVTADKGEPDLAQKVRLRQLDLLHELMSETSKEGNAFLAKYMFGGMIAVIALLNADLVLLNASALPSLLIWQVVIVVLAIVALSGLYFWVVTRHYTTFLRSHRKLKYKFEITLHSLLLRPAGGGGEYSRLLEESAAADVREGFEDEYPAAGEAGAVFDYLLNHHRERCGDLRKSSLWPYLPLALSMVVLTIAIRLLPLIFAML